MISLSEEPKLLIINNALGHFGYNKTDDKPFVHKYNDLYYLSWGCFYSTYISPYGPFDYVGVVINQNLIAPDFKKGNQTKGFLFFTF